MDFISNKAKQIQEMLSQIGVESIDDLFVDIPRKIKREAPSMDDGLSEYEGIQWMRRLAEKNTFSKYDHYMGGGCYEHHVPALVGAVTAKSEFLTAYTPYQAEASQGMLQIIFEFQSAVCALTGMDVSNASLYDGASACAEALLMALRLKKPRMKVHVAGNLHPQYLATVRQYLECHGAVIEIIPYDENGMLNLEAFKNSLNHESAAVLIQNPNFFGAVEAVEELFHHAKTHGAISILCGNPLAYGIYKTGSEWGADIVVGDMQPFGIPMQFGGPHVGYIACKNEFVRQLPGRIVGETQDTEGRRGFVLTLQAREQHIRREKATSNICSNQALAALASLIALLWYGKKGIQELALTNYQRASFLRKKLSEIKGITLLNDRPILNEFTVRYPLPIETVLAHYEAHGILPGIALEKFFPDMTNCLLVAVTETKHLNQLERFVEVTEMLMEEK